MEGEEERGAQCIPFSTTAVPVLVLVLVLVHCRFNSEPAENQFALPRLEVVRRPRHYRICQLRCCFPIKTHANFEATTIRRRSHTVRRQLVSSTDHCCLDVSMVLLFVGVLKMALDAVLFVCWSQ